MLFAIIIMAGGRREVPRFRNLRYDLNHDAFLPVFLDLPHPHPDPFCADSAPDPSISSKNSKKTFDFYSFVTSL
jgi:hypothetical protein